MPSSKTSPALNPDKSVLRDSPHAQQDLQHEIKSLRRQITEYELASQARVKQLDSLSSALQESEKRYDSLFSQLPFGIKEGDYSLIKKAIDKLQADGVEDFKQYFRDNPKHLRELVGLIEIVNVNEALLEIYREDSLQGYLLGHDDIDEWWDYEWEEYYASLFSCFAVGDKFHEEECAEIRSDGSVFEIRLMTIIVRASEQTWDRVITVFEDITNRNHNEAILVDAKITAEKASKAKTEFLSKMSHELRTPLNAILGFSQLFEYDKSLDEQRQSNARAINSAGKHLLKLIEEILDLSRIEGGNIDISMESVSIEAAITDSVNWVADMAKSRGINIDFDVGSCRDLMVEADAIRLKQIFLNLMTNAVKYNRENGNVNIVCTRDRGDLARISITDTGPGISPDRLNHLFKPFNRLGAEFSGVEGTGIGLVITRQLVHLMHGELDVESSPGVGSTFTVQFKIIPNHLLAIDDSSGNVEFAEQNSTALLTSKPYILIAEDNPVNRQLMAAQLDLLGYSADYAENGVEALELWKSGNYRLLLTDIRMPKMGGYELIGQIRAMESNTSVCPIIAVTANAMEGDVRKCIDIGANDVLSKPFGLDDLRQVLEKWSVEQFATETAVIIEPNASPGSVVEAIDLSKLRESVGDKPEVHRQLLESYIKTLPKALEDIQLAFGWRNYEQLGEHAHKLKSSSLSMGATQLASFCQALELACRENKEEDVNATVPKLLQAAEPVMVFVDAFCGDTRATIVEKMSTSIEDSSKSQLSVLLVDDDYIIHRVTTLILNDLGVKQIYSAMSGHEALTILEEMKYAIDIVICDLNMPEMDGIEFTRHLARRNYPGSLALLSGEDIRILKTVEKLAIEHDLHVLGILEKPITQIKLYQLLNLYDEAVYTGTVWRADAVSLEELSTAIKEDQLDVYFQPKVDTKTRKVLGVEGLVRWRHPENGIISPNAFIPMAEESGLIFELTLAVCRKALGYAAAWRAQGIELDIALNISVDALIDLDWPDAMAVLVEAAGLKPESVTFEITESRLMENLTIALDVVSRLSLKRFNLSIDDFGTGYSSMEQLQRIPFSELKIDRAFVHGASEDGSARAILETSVLLAKRLNMKVVAEGVETEEDWNIVAQLGCDQVQGYYIARPMSAAQFIEWLGDWQISKL